MGAQVREQVYKRQRCTFIVFTLGSSEVCVRTHIGMTDNSSSEQFIANTRLVSRWFQRTTDTMVSAQYQRAEGEQWLPNKHSRVSVCVFQKFVYT